MEKKPRKDLMLDIETLGQEPGCIILSVAIKEFSLHKTGTEHIFGYDEYIDIFSQLLLHSHSDYKTEEWWSKQSEEAKNDIKEGQDKAIDVEDAMQNLYDILSGLNKNYDIYVWGRGVGSFDIPILDDCMRRVWEKHNPGAEYKTPLPYYKAMDVRTLVNFCKELGMEMPKVDTPHIAIDDVEKQIKEVEVCVQALSR